MGRLLGMDYGVLYFAGAQQRPWLTPIMAAVTRLGSLWILCVVVIVAAALLAWFGRRRQALGLLATGLFCLALDGALKFAVGRERPDVVWRAVELPTWPSFP